MNILIKNGHIIDPANNVDSISDILISNGKISKIGKNLPDKSDKIIDAKDKIVSPGFIDMHTHLREPGREDKETIATGSYSAAKGGFTTICAMPNTNPVCDNRQAVEYIMSEARKSAVINVLPIGAISVGQKGEILAEISGMKKGGIIAISDDGYTVKDSQLMRRAMEYADMLGIVVISHCEDMSLSADGVMNEGLNSTLLGLKGIPSCAESIIIARDIFLAELTKTKLHIAHVSTSQSVKLMREAKLKGLPITSETCPHYFSLTDDNIKTYDTNFKVNPPLRTSKDIEAIKKALSDGIIDVIATDHAPHTESDKDMEFDSAPFGMIGLETALGVSIAELINTNIITWTKLIELLSLRPAQILKLEKKGSLSIGNDSDLVIIDPDSEWELRKSNIVSKSKNSPFIGKKFKGEVLYTICGGRVVYNRRGE